MIIREGSDFHSEFMTYKGWRAQDNGRDFNSHTFLTRMENEKEQVLLLPGDICAAQSFPKRFFGELSDRFKAVFYVAGNHESYNFDISKTAGYIKEELKDFENVHYLENDVVTFEGVDFIGATLWTNFHGRDVGKMLDAQFGMTDFRAIKNGELIWTPDMSADAHDYSKAFIDLAIKRANDEGRKSVVLTHHAPSFESIHPKYFGATLNAAFSSNLYELIMNRQPTLWAHGHMHDNFDYKIGETRVIVNPYGYRHRRIENPDYNYQLTLEI